MDVVVADASAADLFAASVGAPAAAVGDAADLLHVDVDQVAGGGSFVAQGRGLAGPDHLPGQRVALTQVGHLVSAQDGRDRPGRHAGLDPDPVLPAPLLAPQLQYPLLDLDRSSSWTGPWTRGAVVQTGITRGPVPGYPPVGALA